MKILVDELPEKCSECQFCVDGFMMTPLGIQKQICICTVTSSLIPQNPQEPPKTIEKEESPLFNNCLFSIKETGSIIL